MAGKASELLGQNLKGLLRTEGRSPTGLAQFLTKRLGKEVKPQMVSRWSTGKVLPRNHYISLIAEYCGVEVYELFSPGSDLNPPKPREIPIEEALRRLCKDYGFTIKRLRT